MYQLLCCGSNGLGQLGNGTLEDTDVVSRAKFHFGEGQSEDLEVMPVKVACGGNHTVVLMENGEVYGAGSNQASQIGLEKEQEYVVFTKLPLKKVKYVLCGWEFSVFVTENGDVYTCGSGAKGEIGRGKVQRSLLEKIINIDGIIDVQSSLSHTVLRTADNTLYGWGTSRRGELGKVEQKYIDTPTKLEFPISANWMFYAVGRYRTVFCHDKITMNKEGDDLFQELYSASSVTALKAMWSSVHIVCDNKIISTGNNSHGQLCKYTAPIEAMYTGSEHGLAVTDNKVLAWGWGEHGNCGHTDDDSVVYDMNCIYDGSQPLMVAGGCATSWIVVASIPTNAK